MNDIRNNELAAEQYDALQRNLEFMSYNNPKIPDYPCTNCTCKLVPKNYNYIEYRERKEKERNAKNKHS